MARKPSAAKTTTPATAEKETPVSNTSAAPAAPEGVAWGAPQPAAPAINLAVLDAIVKATAANSFVHVLEADYAPLVAAGFAEVNPGIVDSNGAVATRATAQGTTYMSENPAPVADTATAPVTSPAPATPVDPSAQPVEAPTAASVTEAPKPAAPRPSPSSFKIVKRDISQINTRATTGRAPAYPFDDLEVGDSFFVPNTPEKPDARKSMASTVSSATRRYAKETGEFRTAKVAGVERQIAEYVKVRDFALEAGSGDEYGFEGQKGAIVTRIK